jgi:arsenate reductase
MSDWTIFHNPRCSKSRETLQLLEKAGITPKVVDYLKNAPSEATLLLLMEMIPPSEMVRTKEDKYKELKFPLDDKKAIARQLNRHPELLERPIVIKGKAAVIGRPPENVKKLFK